MEPTTSLKHRAVAGALWAIVTSVLARAFGLVGTLTLTRFVAPVEYGTISVAAVIVTTASAITTLGFGHYVVAHPRADDRTTFHATLYHFALGVLLLAPLVWFAGWFARLFDTPNVEQYIPWLVVAAGLERLSYIPARVLAREMRFKSLSTRLFLGEICYVVTSVGLAAAGWRGWAIVGGIVARAAVTAAVTLGALELKQWFCAGRLSLDTTKNLLRFGLPMALAHALHWLSKRGDNLLMAAMFGPAVAGHYNLAKNLADVPATQVGEQIGDVLLPSFAKMDDDGARKRALSRAIGLLALLVFPLAFGIGAIAPTLVHAVFAPAWWGVAPLLVVLSMLSVVRPIGWLVAAYLQAMQRARLVLCLELTKGASMLLFVVTLGQLGPRFACAAIGLAFAAHAAGSLWSVHRKDGVSLYALARPMVAPLCCCAPLAGAVALTRLLMAGLEISPWLYLLAEIAAGAAGYIASALVVAGAQSQDLLHLVRSALRRPEPAVSGA